MGLLDNKTRMMDTILTQEGRRQLAQGELRVSFVTFTDADIFYQGDVSSGSADVMNRPMLEATCLPQDQVTFEADDAGKLMPFKASSLSVTSGQLFSGSSDLSLTIVTGSEFASTAGLLLASSVDNFRKLYSIGTQDNVFDDEREFSLSVDDVEFSITDHVPFKPGELTAASIDDIESLFQDKRLSHVINFMHLPPVNEPSQGSGEATPLGTYPSLGQRTSTLTYEQLQRDLIGREAATIEFTATSLKSNIMCQLFELNNNSLTKLDVIDFGNVTADDPDFPEKHVFFAGKVMVDGFGVQTFINIFTLVVE